MLTNPCYEITKFGFDGLHKGNYELAKLKDNEVLIESCAWSLNYRDLMMIKGIYNPKLKLPIIPLSDVCGKVIEIGSQVKNFKLGDLVCPNFMPNYTSGPLLKEHVQNALGGAINGVLAQKLKFEETGLVKLPSNLSAVQGATLPCAALTAWSALLEYNKCKPGDTILTFGSGGVSLFSIAFAKLCSVKSIVVSSKEERFDDLKRLGATHCLNYKTNPKWDDDVLEITNGIGVDHVIELGGANTLEKSVKVTKLNGTISLIGVLAGIGSFNPISVLMKAIKIQGIFVGHKQMFERMNKAIELNNVIPVIDDKLFNFNNVPKAYEYFEQGQHFGKVVISKD